MILSKLRLAVIVTVTSTSLNSCRHIYDIVNFNIKETLHRLTLNFIASVPKRPDLTSVSNRGKTYQMPFIFYFFLFFFFCSSGFLSSLFCEQKAIGFCGFLLLGICLFSVIFFSRIKNVP